MKPSLLARRRASHVILFGDPKTGKSTLAAKLLMEGFHLTWISMDNGHEVIFKLPISKEEMDERLNIIVIPDTKEFPIAFGTCRKIMTGAAVSICDIHGQVECSTCKRLSASFTSVCINNFTGKDVLVFDHAGQIAKSCMHNVLKKVKDGLEDDYKPQRDDYMAQGVALDGFYTNLQQSRANVVMITHTFEAEMEDGRKKLIPIIGTGNFSRNSGSYFDHLIFCEMGSGAHKFSSASTYKATVVTGSRTDVTIEKLKEPSLAPFFDGTVLPPEEAGSSAVRKLLDTKVPEVPAVKEEKVPELKVPEEVPANANTIPTESTDSLPRIPDNSGSDASVPVDTSVLDSNQQPFLAKQPTFARSELLAKLKGKGR